ncbi:alpha/beta hydrolase [Polyangium jinanense]|uniref:Alpha/beta fold hydrolase n=1 Tax=Polyangium jinanense TaxID=2829994 RepID=A0A9X4AXW3_9BACT|nr:alpha/beta hydrolase [Polyangium jinanense]MDC3955738.1 alpha/beta fold hydrolase [Polyangium jinanense]MDC3986705.1 alpha/beta fold hydrolase [Polyangium jinanense]
MNLLMVTIARRLSGAFPFLVSPLFLGCGGDPDPPQAPPAPGISWEDCGGGFECATFSVPVDHDAPDGRTFSIPLVRRPAAVPSARIGSLLVNPGGPGASGVGWARAAQIALPQRLKDRFDLVGFDPRGQAGSTPAIDCVDDLAPLIGLDPTPDDDAERAALVAGADAFAAACKQRSGDLLPFVGTNNIARDMDLLREALGDDKLTYVGFSYGTFLGTIYAEAYPDRVRALVLDGTIDPTVSGDAFIKGQALGFEAELEAFLADCAAKPACAFHSGGDPWAAYDAVKAAVEASPLPAPPGGTRTLGPGELIYAVSQPLYNKHQWKYLAQALALAAAGDGSGLLEFADAYVARSADGTYDASFEVYYGVTSIDNTFPNDPQVYQNLTNELQAKAPRIGMYLPATALPSARWAFQPWRSNTPISADGAPPILVVGSTGDPATPYPWAVSLAAQLSSGVLLTREGPGHISFLRGNTCIDQAVTDYLVDRKLPPEGTTCK